MKLMLTPTSGVLSEVTTCPRMTQAWLHGSEKNQQLHTLAYIQVYKQIQSKNNNDCIGLYNIFTSCMQRGRVFQPHTEVEKIYSRYR